MAENIGTFVLEVKSSKEAQDALRIMEKHGISQTAIKTTSVLDKQGNVTPRMMSGEIPTKVMDAVQKDIKATLPGNQGVFRQQGDTIGWGKRLKETFSQKNMMQMNKSLFMMQMASLGVAFSFQSLEKQIVSIFSGLSDLGSVLSGNALASAYSSMATGGTGGDILKTMGVNTEDVVKAWEGFNAITNAIQTLTNGLATKVLTPAMVSAILTVIDAIANELAKPEIVKAIQDIMLAVLDTVKQMIPLLPTLAAIITYLSDHGLLGALVAIVLVAPYLLSLMSLMGFAFQAIIIILPGLLTLMAGVEAILGGTLLASIGAIILVIGAFAIIIDFVKNLFVEFGNYGISLEAVWAALGDTLADIINFITSAIKTLTFGAVDLTGSSNGTKTSSTATTNNYYNYGNLTKDSDTKWTNLG